MIPKKRLLFESINHQIKRGKSILLLGPRQTGKTTLAKALPHDRYINFMDTSTRLRYEQNRGILSGEIHALAKKLNKKPFVVLDEIQKIPPITDDIQVMIDDQVAQFFLTGSSARKIRNLLPGRVVKFQLDPFLFVEHQQSNIEQLLTYGSLPGILNTPHPKDQETDLTTYVETYLEEEVRKEALVRNLGHFSKFLQLAAVESGNIVSFRALSQELGIVHPTIAAYYQILEDCMLVERVEPLTQSLYRKRLTKSSKHILFDLGIRRACAKEGTQANSKTLGLWLEQWVGLELRRLLRTSSMKGTLKFWRDPDGPEVDWVLDFHEHYIPIEVKWTDMPSKSDCKHLRTFLDEYPQAKQAYVVCRTPRPIALFPDILAISWTELENILLSAQ